MIPLWTNRTPTSGANDRCNLVSARKRITDQCPIIWLASRLFASLAFRIKWSNAMAIISRQTSAVDTREMSRAIHLWSHLSALETV